MTQLNEILSRLDHWRNFPNFQLERHVDVFISFYLKEILAGHYNKNKDEIGDCIIPEFPINISGEYDHVDFAVPSTDLLTVYFIELKTDVASRRRSQDKLMEDVSGMNFQKLLSGLIDKAVRTKNFQSKYATLLLTLEQVGYINVPKEFWKLDFMNSPYGYKKLVRGIEIAPIISAIKLIFIQPSNDNKVKGVESISLSECSSIINKTNDPMSTLLSELLVKWSQKPGLI